MAPDPGIHTHQLRVHTNGSTKNLQSICLTPCLEQVCENTSSDFNWESDNPPDLIY